MHYRSISYRNRRIPYLVLDEAHHLARLSRLAGYGEAVLKFAAIKVSLRYFNRTSLTSSHNHQKWLDNANLALQISHLPHFLEAHTVVHFLTQLCLLGNTT